MRIVSIFLLTLLAFIGSARPVGADGIEYPLASFRTTDIVYNTLFFQLRGSQRSGRDSYDHLPRANEASGPFDQSAHGWETDTRGGLIFRRREDRRTYVRQFDAEVSFGVGIQNRTSDTEDSRSGSAQTTAFDTEGVFPRAGGRFEAREQHYVYGLSFWQIDAQLTYDYDRDRETTDRDDIDANGTSVESVVESRSRTERSSAEFGIGGGIGRLYDLSHVRMGLYILDDLADRGVLVNEPGREVIEEFGHRLRQLEQDRVFDDRKKRMYQLREIVAFLQDRDLVGVLDVDGFASINDNLRFGREDTERSTGMLVSLTARSSYGRREHEYSSRDTRPDQNIDRKDSRRDTDKRWFGDLTFRHEKPLSKFWQLSSQIQVQGGRRREDRRSETRMNEEGEDVHSRSKGELTRSFWDTGAELRLSWFPNSRDWLFTSLEAEFFRESGALRLPTTVEPDRLVDVVEQEMASGIELGWLRYLSLKTTMRVSFKVRQRDHSQEEVDKSGSVVSEHNLGELDQRLIVSYSHYLF